MKVNSKSGFHSKIFFEYTFNFNFIDQKKNKKNIFDRFIFFIYKFIVCHFNKMNDILKIVLIFFGLLHFYEQNYRKMLDD